MREHMGLFRGKRTDNGEWVEGYLHIYADRAFILCSIDWVRVDPTTIGECTGLRDKNGKWIWEGDICRNTKTGEAVSVKWHGTMAGFVWSRRIDHSYLHSFGELFRAYDKYEVIGNVVDNPELLKGGE